MHNSREKMDLPKTIFLLMFILSMIIVSFYTLRPFMISFLWSGMIVIATWPIFLKIKSFLGGNKNFSSVFLTFFLLIFLIYPFFYIINLCIKNSYFFLEWLSSNHFQLPNLHFLINLPYVGKKLYILYQKILNSSGRSLIQCIKPYLKKTTKFLFLKIGYFTNFLLQIFLMLVFNLFLYCKGEKVANILRHFAIRLASTSGDIAVLLAARAIRAVALGVIVTSLVQGFLSTLGLAVSGIPYYTFLIFPIFFLNLLQIGSFPILLPAIIWLYWMNFPVKGTILLIWSIINCILDNVLRAFLIRFGVDFPALLLLAGMIGGIISFGLIGLFVGPVVLVIAYRLIIIWINKAPFPHNLNKKISKNLFKKHTK
ncbi:AI-2E family transporter YdiK [Buchnera aphidicola]|uniref:UPF0118 inner membrane protein YdiK n=1 Tax=Buchnera aphidicola subsp. Tuberolachnus salignus TaxID=98804 RepID=A0A160SXZ2_BUCTT|nr:AI-2E family transporter YdiK [Buchnera aphidicola]CUR53064.1 UPF0118 inner membrane protein YdiK [Buchnera aphidicola (Tuberolachnus salignus)]